MALVLGAHTIYRRSLQHLPLAFNRLEFIAFEQKSITAAS